MTLNLKLVRHQDGKWTALTPETDDLAQVSVKEKKCAPIDPAHLLKALDSVLSPECGIRSIEDVPRMACLMKKFSKKLVSRCVYCNVLQATKPEILSEFLDKGGWETINTWLQYSKTSSSNSFLVELLKLCKLLPMTLNRLKENNTAKVIKSLTKHDNDDVKYLSSELVNQWMSIIKVKKAGESTVDKKRKKEKVAKPEKFEPPKEVKASSPPTELKAALSPPKEVKASSPPKTDPESPKAPIKLKGLKRTSTDRENKKVEIYEDVKIDPEPLLPVSKKPRPNRPKTVKIYQKKFRATGLEEETPLPKNINKKTSTVDKTVVAAAAKNALKMSPSAERITEKKIKPESLMAINESANTKGIKLIPAKPRPTFLQESASFMDALISQPVVPIKRKKKVSAKNAPNTSPTPTSPTITPPKLQFYKDTLEMNEEAKKEEPEKTDSEVPNEENSENIDSSNMEEIVPMDTTEEGGHTPPNEDSVDINSPSDSLESQKETEPRQPFDPNNLRSILCHGRRRNKKKSVKWVEDSSIKEVFYFEMDDTERVNVSRNSSFYDLKSIEMKRERETMEMAKRQTGDRVEEFRRWWPMPIIIDCLPPPAVPGCNSTEKFVEILRQQSTLQEIYFTREMIPDSPHEPDLEIHPAKEPRVIPFDENNAISAVNDYSNYTIIKPPLPDILSALMKINTIQSPTQTQSAEPVPMALDSQVPNQPLPNPDIMMPPHLSIPHSQPYEPVLGPEPIPIPASGLLGHAPPPFNPAPAEGHGMELQGEWRTPQELSPTDQYYAGYPVNPNIPPNQHHPPIGGNIRPQGNIRPNFRGGPRGNGNRPPRRVICRHFASGHCRFGMSCSFLHPGVNGPPL